MFSAVFSSITRIYLGFFATGGIIPSLGFIGLGIIWLYTTTSGYVHIVNRQINKHQILMYYSYAVCFTAVTLRIWLPILSVSFGNFVIAYRVVAWLCWIPNLIVAYYFVNKIKLNIEI